MKKFVIIIETPGDYECSSRVNTYPIYGESKDELIIELYNEAIQAKKEKGDNLSSYFGEFYFHGVSVNIGQAIEFVEKKTSPDTQDWMSTDIRILSIDEWFENDCADPTYYVVENKKGE